MLAITLLLLFVATKGNTLSIGVKESNIAKRESIGDYFPDWVPFKNKHGEELGEFIDVPKPKPKKRLAPPMNFMLKVSSDKEVAYDEQEGNFTDDYYDDAHKPESENNPKNISHSDIAGIDTIVNIITKPSDNFIIKPLVNLRRSRDEKLVETEESDENDSDIYDDNSEHVSEKELKINDKKEKNDVEHHDDIVDSNNRNSKDSIKSNEEKKEEKNINHISKEKDIKEINENIQSSEPPNEYKESHKNKADVEDHDEKDNGDHKNEDNENNQDEYYEHDNIEDKEVDKVEDEEKEKNINQSDDKKYYKEGTSKEIKEGTSKEDKEDNSKEDKEDNSKEDKGDTSKEHKKEDEISEQQRQEDEAKKAKILSSVDELKERHAKEQRRISERDEEMIREERMQDRYRTDEDDDKYGKQSYSRWIHAPIEDDEYQDEEDPEFDKYKIISHQPTSTTTKKPVSTKKRKTKNKPNSKLSTFRNADTYLFDDDGEKTDQRSDDTESVKIRSPKKFSARYSASTTPPLPEDDIVRISLVPPTDDDDVKVHFRKKSKSRRKYKTTPPPKRDTFSSEAVDPISTSPGATGSDTDPSESVPFSSISNTAPSAPDAASVNFAPSATNTLPSDAAPAESETALSAADTGPSASETGPSAADAADSTIASSNKEVEKKSEDYHSEKGGGRQHDSEHEEDHEEHGKKAYEGVHKETKTRKGHHDKEDHHGKYHDHGGEDKRHHEEDGHYGHHNHEEHGKKFAKYEESGKHSKGHSTKGSHDIHKKDEYEKKVEFFEEEGDSTEEEKHGGHHDEKGHKKGGHYNKSNLQAAHKGHHKGEKGHFNKNGFTHIDKGHKSSGGHDGHGRHAQAHLHKEAGGGGKKWIFHHGHPARSANLVVIDRRQDRLQQGPVYYG